MTAPFRRHRFDPARLVLGLALLAIAGAFLADVSGRRELPLPLLLALLPVALLLAAVVAVATLAFRRGRRAAPGAGAAPGGGGDEGGRNEGSRNEGGRNGGGGGDAPG